MDDCLICLEESSKEDLDIHSSKRLIRLCMSNCECNGFVHVKCLQDWVNRNPSVNRRKCVICRTDGENYTLMECESAPSHTPMPTLTPIVRDTSEPLLPPYHIPQPNIQIEVHQVPQEINHAERRKYTIVMLSIVTFMFMIWFVVNFGG